MEKPLKPFKMFPSRLGSRLGSLAHVLGHDTQWAIEDSGDPPGNTAYLHAHSSRHLFGDAGATTCLAGFSTPRNELTIATRPYGTQNPSGARTGLLGWKKRVGKGFFLATFRGGHTAVFNGGGYWGRTGSPPLRAARRAPREASRDGCGEGELEPRRAC